MGLFDMFTSLFQPALKALPGAGSVSGIGAIPSVVQGASPFRSLMNKVKPFAQQAAMGGMMGGGQQRQPLQPPAMNPAPVAPPNISGVMGENNSKSYSMSPGQLDAIGNMDSKTFQMLQQNGFFDSFTGE